MLGKNEKSVETQVLPITQMSINFVYLQNRINKRSGAKSLKRVLKERLLMFMMVLSLWKTE